MGKARKTHLYLKHISYHLVAATLGACASPAHVSKFYTCEAYCNHRVKDGSLRREMIDGSGANMEQAWSALNEKCKKMSVTQSELQVHPFANPEAQEFVEATPELACRL